MKTILAAGMAAAWLIGSAFPASGAIIDDNFIGAAHDGVENTSDYYNPTPSVSYDITKMDVTFSATALSAKIYSDYFGAWVSGASKIELGDLFLSTNGWQPYGTASYGSDDSTNGESWEYVVDLNQSALAAQAASGNVTLLQTNASEGVVTTGSVRDAQEWNWITLLDPASPTGTWQILSDTDGYYLLLESSLSGAFAGVTTLGLHYTMACGNDVIEGAVTNTAPVPEPSTIILFGAGLAGLAGFGRRRQGTK